MKITHLLPVLALFFGSATCSSPTDSCKLGQPIQLQIGEMAQCKERQLQLVAVKEDSRCPEYANCVWEGQAVVQLALGEEPRETIDLTLREGKPELSSQTMGGYIFRLTDVSPYPVSGQQIKPDDYLITLVVEAI
ncbi:hypothetical protein [Phaeodactylibacter luteus]|uniref:Uncharacterized protein n=1 Tax=Phaeodactylibacter luteus TaxID=1564516 RepID=A0A5C6RGA6_9BACT|nr:hypothetical protein [Phaeodactylibacter luteus]TXB61468.1 hypothetical protein FRY97_19005 [Phaeodactylibacter luteus]